MRKLKVGDKVVLKPSYAKWHLDNQDIYFSPSGRVDESFDSQTQLHLMSCMGVPVPGKVTHINPGESNTYYKIKFSLAGLRMEYWTKATDVELLNG